MISNPFGIFLSSFTTRISVYSLSTACGTIFFKSIPHLCLISELGIHFLSSLMSKWVLEDGLMTEMMRTFGVILQSK